MKVIDLLNKIANEKKYPKIKFNNSVYEYHDKEHVYCRYYHDNTYICLDTDYYLFDILNDEVEVIEEDNKIEKVPTYMLCDNDFYYKGEHSLKATEIIDKAFEEYSHKINEIIDKINEEE